MKTASALSRILKAAYAQPPARKDRPTESLPDPLYDLIVVGLFFVLGIAYFA